MAILCPVTKAVYLDCGESSISRHTDYFKPLHVDCSVEYELPSCAKPPSHSSSDGGRREPLLMIHPSYYRREESRHRDPFIINLPTKLRSLDDWKTPTKTSKSRSTLTASRNPQHRKRMLDLSPSSTSSCICTNSLNRPLPPTLTSSTISKDGCPCGKVHQPMAMEPIKASLWSNCGATIEDLRTDKRLATSTAAIGMFFYYRNRFGLVKLRLEMGICFYLTFFNQQIFGKQFYIFNHTFFFLISWLMKAKEQIFCTAALWPFAFVSFCFFKINQPTRSSFIFLLVDWLDELNL